MERNMGTLHLQLMGAPRVWWEGEDITSLFKSRTLDLLICLAFQPDQCLERRELARLLWADSVEVQALSNLRTQLALLRKCLPESAQPLEIDRQLLRLRPAPHCTVDALAFLQEARAAQQSPQVTAALAHYAGSLLPMRYDAWLTPFREALDAAYISLLLKGILLLEAEGEQPRALLLARRLVLHDPLEEAHQARLIHLLRQTGDLTGALAASQAYREHLRAELDVAPGEELEALHKTLLQETQAGPPDASGHPPALGRLAHTQPFVGRRQEREALLNLWRTARGGQLRAALLRGPSGIGRTRLLEEMVQTLRREGGMVCLARCLELHDALPYAAAAQLLSQLRLDRLTPSLRRELSRLLPELLDPASGLRPPTPGELTWPLRHALNAALSQAVLAQQPLLLALDDLQWVDLETLGWLHSLLAAHPQARVLLVLALKAEPRPKDLSLEATLRELLVRPEVLELSLAPLALSETAQLLSSGRERPLDADVCRRIHLETGGNPFLIQAFVQQQETRPASEDALSPLRSALELRLQGLSSEALSLLEVAALSSHPVDAPLLARACGLPSERVLELLDELWQRQLMRQEGFNRYAVAVPSQARLIQARLSPPRLRALHRRLGAALLHASDPPSLDQRLEAARHLAWAGAWEDATHLALETVQQAHGENQREVQMQASQLARDWAAHSGDQMLLNHVSQTLNSGST